MDHAALIAARFPHLARLPRRALGAGEDHLALLVDERIVLRIPSAPDAAAALAREAAITAWLAPSLPLPIPRYTLLAPDIAGYALLPGTPALLATTALDLPAVGAALGGFLRALHDLDPAHPRALGAPDDDDPSLELWAEVAFEDLAVVRALLDASTRAAVAALLARRPQRASAPPRLLHADLAAEHVLLDPCGAPCGVIDWSDLFIGDIAHDLAGLLHWGGQPLLASALAAYGPIDPLTHERAAWLAACRAVADMRFSLDAGRPAYMRAGRAALAHLLG